MAYVTHEEEMDCADGVKRRVVIEQDEFPSDPLEDNDWCEMVTPKGMRSSYGHKQVDGDWLRPLDDGKVPYLHGDEEWGLDSRSPIVVLPVAKYEHSGVMLYVGSGPRAGDPGGWDSGQIGWIWMDAKGFKEWSGDDWVETPENVKRVEEALESVVDEYSHYVSGDCWAYRIQKLVACDEGCKCGRDPTWEDDEDFTSCGGYIGDWDDCGVLEDGKELVESQVKHDLAARRPAARLKKWLRERWRAVRRAFCKHVWGQQATVMTTKRNAITAQWCSKGCGARKKEVKAA